METGTLIRSPCPLLSQHLQGMMLARTRAEQTVGSMGRRCSRTTDVESNRSIRCKGKGADSFRELDKEA